MLPGGQIEPGQDAADVEIGEVESDSFVAESDEVVETAQVGRVACWVVGRRQHTGLVGAHSTVDRRAAVCRHIQDNYDTRRGAILTCTQKLT